MKGKHVIVKENGTSLLFLLVKDNGNYIQLKVITEFTSFSLFCDYCFRRAANYKTEKTLNTSISLQPT